MSKVKSGDRIKVHYTGKMEDGTVFDSSKGRQPLEFNVGLGQVIPGFEKGVMGMEVGDSKTVVIPPEQGYGKVREDLIADVNKGDFPENITPEIGKKLQIEQDDGSKLHVTITRVGEEKVTLDANHPLAGKTLTFDIELLEIA